MPSRIPPNPPVSGKHSHNQDDSSSSLKKSAGRITSAITKTGAYKFESSIKKTLHDRVDIDTKDPLKDRINKILKKAGG